MSKKSKVESATPEVKKKVKASLPKDAPTPALPKTRGIFILAMGHAYYGLMAYNLALSIKAQSPDAKITLGYADNSLSHLGESSRAMFDKIIHVPEKFITKDGMRHYVKAKTHLYELSPYDETLVLDADMVWLPRRGVNQLFEELSEVEFTMQARGRADISNHVPDDFSWWCNVNQLKEKWGFSKGWYYNLSSEVIWFKKTDKVKQFFKTAQDAYADPLIDFKSFGGYAIPDELVFAISMIRNDFYPHRMWIPAFWEQAEGTAITSPSQLYDSYYLLSAGGKRNSKQTIKYYDGIVHNAGRHFGVTHLWKLKHKGDYLPERTHI